MSPDIVAGQTPGGMVRVHIRPAVLTLNHGTAKEAIALGTLSPGPPIHYNKSP